MRDSAAELIASLIHSANPLDAGALALIDELVALDEAPAPPSQYARRADPISPPETLPAPSSHVLHVHYPPLSPEQDAIQAEMLRFAWTMRGESVRYARDEDDEPLQYEWRRDTGSNPKTGKPFSEHRYVNEQGQVKYFTTPPGQGRPQAQPGEQPAPRPKPQKSTLDSLPDEHKQLASEWLKLNASEVTPENEKRYASALAGMNKDQMVALRDALGIKPSAARKNLKQDTLAGKLKDLALKGGLKPPAAAPTVDGAHQAILAGDADSVVGAISGLNLKQLRELRGKLQESGYEVGSGGRSAKDLVGRIKTATEAKQGQAKEGQPAPEQEQPAAPELGTSPQLATGGEAAAPGVETPPSGEPAPAEPAADPWRQLAEEVGAELNEDGSDSPEEMRQAVAEHLRASGVAVNDDDTPEEMREAVADAERGKVQKTAAETPPSPPAPEESAPKRLSGLAAKHLDQFGKTLKASAHLTPGQKLKFAKAAHGVLSRMTPAMLERFDAGLHGPTHFAGSTEGVREHLLTLTSGHPADAEKIRKAGDPAGAYVKRAGKGSLVLDGDHERPTSKTRFGHQDAEETYAHEFAHAVDGPRRELSKSQGWQEAFAAELKGGGLTKYAGTDASEGFAEFGRLLLSGKHDAADVAAAFPKCHAFWQQAGLVEAPAAKTGAESPSGAEVKLPEQFGNKVDLGEQGHADEYVQVGAGQGGEAAGGTSRQMAVSGEQAAGEQATPAGEQPATGGEPPGIAPTGSAQPGATAATPPGNASPSAAPPSPSYGDMSRWAKGRGLSPEAEQHATEFLGEATALSDDEVQEELEDRRQQQGRQGARPGLGAEIDGLEHIARERRVHAGVQKAIAAGEQPLNPKSLAPGSTITSHFIPERPEPMTVTRVDSDGKVWARYKADPYHEHTIGTDSLGHYTQPAVAGAKEEAAATGQTQAGETPAPQAATPEPASEASSTTPEASAAAPEAAKPAAESQTPPEAPEAATGEPGRAADKKTPPAEPAPGTSPQLAGSSTQPGQVVTPKPETASASGAEEAKPGAVEAEHRNRIIAAMHGKDAETFEGQGQVMTGIGLVRAMKKQGMDKVQVEQVLNQMVEDGSIHIARHNNPGILSQADRDDLPTVAGVPTTDVILRPGQASPPAGETTAPAAPEAGSESQPATVKPKQPRKPKASTPGEADAREAAKQAGAENLHGSPAAMKAAVNGVPDVGPMAGDYATLGLRSGAQLADVDRAFRKLAAKYHPDRNPGDTEAEERYKAISDAYERIRKSAQADGGRPVPEPVRVRKPVSGGTVSAGTVKDVAERLKYLYRGQRYTPLRRSDILKELDGMGLANLDMDQMRQLADAMEIHWPQSALDFTARTAPGRAWTDAQDLIKGSIAKRYWSDDPAERPPAGWSREYLYGEDYRNPPGAKGAPAAAKPNRPAKTPKKATSPGSREAGNAAQEGQQQEGPAGERPRGGQGGAPGEGGGGGQLPGQAAGGGKQKEVKVPPTRTTQQSVKAFEDAKLPSRERLERLADMDVEVFDNLVNSGEARRVGIPHNEFFRRIDASLGRYQDRVKNAPGDEWAAQEAQKQLIQDLGSAHQRTQQAIVGLRKLAAEGKQGKTLFGEPIDYGAVADLYEKMLPQAIAVARSGAGIG